MPFGIAAADFFKLFEQFALPVGEVDRRFDDDVAQQVALADGAHAFDALAVIGADHEPRATEYVSEMLEL